ncbi:MAG: phosphonate ABC transporter substrate-binding protein [Rhodospirillales bacterium]|jgi:phosphonate transport system substrate-binding protein
MISRRSFLAASAALGLAGVARPSSAQQAPWAARYPELTFAIIPAENASGVMDRWGPFTAYLTRELGTKVTIRVAQDYAAVIEGQRAGQIQIAIYGPAAYARARMTGVRTTPFALTLNDDGSTGYYAVFFVRANSPYRSIEDLKGKNLGLVDPNSASGNMVPRMELDRRGIRPSEFFANVVYTGSHENAIIALQQGTVDVAANSWTSDTISNLRRMADKGMVKLEDFRIIHRSDEIVNSPVAYLDSLPDDLKAAIRTAFLEAPTRDPEAFRRAYLSLDRSLKPVTHEAYLPIIELNQFIDRLRRQGS